MNRRAFLAAALALAAPASAAAQLDRLLKDVPGLPSAPAAPATPSAPGAGLSDAKIVSGLKEALRVGTDNAVKLTGRTDGFFKNEAIKILMPERLQSLERGLRAVGFGPQVDEFVLSMNRAAERAAPAAGKIFGDAFAAMTFEDARGILGGGDTAATEYFKAKTTGTLTTTFQPIVSRAMDEVGVTRRYKELTAQAATLPFVNAQSLDLDRYVVDHSLAGLFHVLGEEERKIRANPAARVTELLRDVFGR